MLKISKSILVVTIILLGAWSAAFADDAPAGGAKGTHPCKQIEDACKAAGFAKGEWKEGKGLFKNCMHPIMEGQSVQGVTVDPAAVQACKARRAEHHARGANAK